MSVDACRFMGEDAAGDVEDRVVALVEEVRGVTGIHLSKAPITEAVLDVWTSGVQVSAHELRAFHEAIAKRFPVVETRRSMVGQFGFAASGSSQASASVQDLGVLVRSEDGLDAAQARVDGFTVNRLKPYQTWTALRELAVGLWPTYLEVARPEAVRKLSLRFINQINLPITAPPLRIEDVGRYLNVSPGRLEPERQELDGFLVRAAFRAGDPEIRSLVTVLSEAPTSGGVPFLLDIDVSREGRWAIDDPSIWALLDEMRTMKNELFFASITPELEEMFR